MGKKPFGFGHLLLGVSVEGRQFPPGVVTVDSTVVVVVVGTVVEVVVGAAVVLVDIVEMRVEEVNGIVVGVLDGVTAQAGISLG